MRLLVEIGQGMLSVGILVANSPAYDWESVFVVSKAILVHARPLGSAPALYSLWRTCRRIRYSRIIHNNGAVLLQSLVACKLCLIRPRVSLGVRLSVPPVSPRLSG